ncbi:MAG: alpha/beta hydrolase [Acidimicrobiia bacterium]|nr:alpha/beta hydrolase [Acidimicrobiia bacterium]
MTAVERVDGVAVYRRPVRGAPRVVFVHGAMDRAATFAKTSRLLRDLEAVRYDRRGYGRSPRSHPAPTFAAQVDELLGVVGDRRSVVVGHSLGGLVALGGAARRPDLVAAVAAWESPLVWADWWPRDSAGDRALAADRDPGEAAERFVRQLIGDERWAKLPPATRDARRLEGPRAPRRTSGRSVGTRRSSPLPTSSVSRSRSWRAVGPRRSSGTGDRRPSWRRRRPQGSWSRSRARTTPRTSRTRRTSRRSYVGPWAEQGPGNRLPPMSGDSHVHMRSGPPETVLEPEPAEADDALRRALTRG